MITITPRAKRLLADHFKDKPRAPIRLFVRLGGCGIRTFGITLESPKRSDRVIELHGFTFVINKKLLNLVGPVTVDSDGIGFRISGSGVAPPTACGNCGNMCGIRGGRRCPGDCATCQYQCGYRSNLKNQASC